MNSSQLIMVAAGAAGASVLLLVWSLTATPGTLRQRALAILERDTARAVATQEVSFAGLAGVARRLTPASGVQRLDRALARVGRPQAWPLERVLVAKLLAAAVATVGALLFWSTNPSVLSLALVGVLSLVGWFVPDLILWNEGQERSKAIEQALPDFLDQLTIAVEAGLGLESAMAHVSRNSGGPLADEFVRTLQDIQVGQTRRVAFLSLAERTSVKDLKRFVRAVVQAEQFGVSIAAVLDTQAREMRIKRRQRAEEKAMKVPVKVVFPLMLCILPVLFIIILGPVAMRIAEAFSGGLGSIGGMP